MNKKATIISVILAVLLIAVLVAVAIFNHTPATKTDDGSNVKPDDVAWHGNGMEALPKVDNEGNPVETTDDHYVNGVDVVQTYTLHCRFEGKMDANSFEVTELDTNSETGETIDGPLVQMRVGNEAVRQDVDILEIGETISVIFKYNEDSQVVAERIMLLSR